MKLQFLLVKFTMDAKRLINFHYNQSHQHIQRGSIGFSSQHIISNTKTLKFTYQIAQPQPIYQKFVSFPSASYAPSAGPLSSLPQQSIKTTKKINLVSTKHRKTKAQSNTLPLSMSTELHDDRKNYIKERQQKLSNRPENPFTQSLNPESAYTYSLPNHIQFQTKNKTNCELFSLCREPDNQEEALSQQKLKQGKNTTISQQIKPSQKELKSPVRQKIFERQRISQFIIPQNQIQFKQPQAIIQTQEQMIKACKIDEKTYKLRSSSRRPLFQFLRSPPKENGFSVIEQSIDINQIPEQILEIWQKNEPNIKQWNPESERQEQYQRQPLLFSASK